MRSAASATQTYTPPAPSPKVCGEDKDSLGALHCKSRAPVFTNTHRFSHHNIHHINPQNTHINSSLPFQSTSTPAHSVSSTHSSGGTIAASLPARAPTLSPPHRA